MPITIIIPTYAAFGGIASALLHTLLYYKLIYGITAPFLTHFGIVAAGLIYGRAGLNVAIAVAGALLVLALPWQDAARIIITQIIPLNLFIRCLMMAVFIPQPQPQLIWSPPCYAVSYVCLYGSIFYFMLIIMKGAIYANVSKVITDVAAISNDNLQIKELTDYIYLLIGVDFIVNLFAIIISIFILHRILRAFGFNRRPNLNFASIHSPPDISLSALALALVISLVATNDVGKAGQCALLILLVPYMYCGIAHVHFILSLTSMSKVFLTLFYLSLILFNATALMMLALYGIINHIGRITWRLKLK